MSLLEELKNTNFPYSPSIVEDLIRHNNKTWGHVKPVTKKIIFYMMKRVILRGVAIFFNINRNRNNEVYYDEEDMVTELFFILNKCVDMFDVDRNKDFYLYFNSSVSRRVSRMANYKKINNDEITFTTLEKQISKEDSDMCLDDVIEGTMNYELENNDFLEYIDSIDWDLIEVGVIDSMKRGRGVRDIMAENKLSKSGYEQMIRRIRDKLTYEMAKEEVLSKILHKL